MADVLARLKDSQEAILLAVIVALFAVFGALSPWFLTVPNWVDLIESYSVTTILALGLFVVLVAGGIDISFMTTASIAQYLAALAIAATLAAGFALSLASGAVTGLMVANMNVHPILVTLGTKSVIDGVSIYLTQGTVIAGLPEPFQWLGNGAVLGGVDPFGGFGRIAGLMMALAVLQVISSGFNLLGLNQYLTLAIWGVTLVSVMAFKHYIAPLLAARRAKETPT